MKKRVLALLMTGSLIAGLLTGCGGSDAKGEQGAQKEEESAGEAAAESGQELTTVKILCKNDFAPDIKVEDWEQYPVSQVVIQDLEEIGIRLELECIDNESFANVVNTRMASGVDLPDLISYCWVGNSDEQDVMDLARNGLLYSVNELVEQYDEDGSIRAFYEEKAPGAWEVNATEDGTVYWFSYFTNGPDTVDKETGTQYKAVYPYVLSIRQDWVEAVGEEKKDVYTPEELFSLLKKLQDEDANGNGQKDEVAHININSFDNGIATGFGLSSNLLGGYFEEDNQVFSNFYHENFPAYIEFMRSLYESGLYDTSSLTSTREQMASENRASVLYGYADWDYENSMPSVEEGVTYYAPILLELDGDLENGCAVSSDNTGVMTYCQYFVPKGCEHPEAVTRLMDYVYSDRYGMLDFLGVEGQSYEVDENGNYVQLAGDFAQTTSFFNIGAGLYALPALNLYSMVRERYSTATTEYLKTKMDWDYRFSTEIYPLADKVEFLAPFLAMATDEEAAFISEKTAVLQTYAEELLSDLILGNKSLDDLAQYQQELEDLGLTRYLEIMQARRDRVIGAE